MNFSLYEISFMEVSLEISKIKGVGGWIWCTYCVYMYVNGKMRPVDIITGIVGEGIKGEWWRG
jgi:hypothetical protein